MHRIYDLVAPAAFASAFQRPIVLTICEPSTRDDADYSEIPGAKRVERLSVALEVLIDTDTTGASEIGARTQGEIRCWMDANKTTATQDEVVHGSVTIDYEGETYRAYEYQKLGPIIRVTFERTRANG